MKHIKKILYIPVLAIISLTAACDDILDVDTPSDIVVREDVFSDPNVIKTAVSGMYAQNLYVNGIYEYMLPLYLSNSADEAYHTSVNFDPLRYNAYSPTTSYIGNIWKYTYRTIFLSNDLIEQISKTSAITEETKRKYIGEAKYFRAYGYFVLVNLFGDVPWVKSTNVLSEGLLPRESKEKIITEPDGIIDDLKYAETALEDSDYPNSFVTKTAASALLARVYLYHNEWEYAETKAGEVIQTSGYVLEPELDKVFVRTSRETIFRASSGAAMPSYSDRTYFGVYALNASYFRLTDELVSSFDEDDLRSEKWLKNEGAYYHCYKYKRNAASAAGAAEDFVLLRLAEQYLIRAEALAQQTKLTGENGAIADVNAIRTRAGLTNLSQNLTKDEVLLAIENERRHELFLEEGHRWWDLVRTGRANEVLGTFSGKLWEPYKSLLPIPSTEIDKNKNLTPNPGY
jgi:hypothetical protein